MGVNVYEYLSRATGKKTYKAIVRITGYATTSKSGFSTKSAARAWGEDKAVKLRKGELVPRGRISRAFKVADLFDKYIEEHLPTTSRRFAYNEEGNLRRWETYIGALPLNQVTSQTLEHYLRVIRQANTDGSDRPKPLANQTVKHYHAAIHRAFEHGVKANLIPRNPVSPLNPSQRKLNNERVRWLSADERTALLQECRNSGSTQLYMIVRLALATGLRRSELMSLTLNDIDLERQKAVVIGAKTGDRRAVHLPLQLISELRTHIARTRAFYDDVPARELWLFPRDDGYAPIIFDHAFRTAVKDAGIIDFHFHDLRHTFASYLAMQGATLLQIREALGHRTLKMVLRYAHLCEHHTESIVESMAATHLAA